MSHSLAPLFCMHVDQNTVYVPGYVIDTVCLVVSTLNQHSPSYMHLGRPCTLDAPAVIEFIAIFKFKLFTLQHDVTLDGRVSYFDSILIA